MMTDTRSWRDSYLTELEQAAAVLPADRRNELLAQSNEHLDGELDGVADAAEAQQVLQRLGDPDDVVAEATADLPMPERPRSAAGEIIALLLMGIGGFALPLIAPFVGVLIMLATPRWNRHQVRVTGLIVGIGVVALMALMVVAASGATSSAAVRGAMAILAVVVLVGPIAALYAATRPR